MIVIIKKKKKGWMNKLNKLKRERKEIQNTYTNTYTLLTNAEITYFIY
jgi:hypothetical protein